MSASVICILYCGPARFDYHFFNKVFFCENDNPLLERVHVFCCVVSAPQQWNVRGLSVICSALLFALLFFPNLHFFPPQVLTQPRSQSERHLAGKYRTSLVLNWSAEKAEQNCLTVCTVVAAPPVAIGRYCNCLRATCHIFLFFSV